MGADIFLGKISGEVTRYKVCPINCFATKLKNKSKVSIDTVLQPQVNS
jgi:hypothetical protein